MNQRDYLRILFDELESKREQVARASHPVQSNPNARIQNLRPHYTNEYFKEARTVYLAKGYRLTSDDELVKGASYNYSDRIRQWDWKKAEAARDTATAQLPETSCAAHIEAYLRAFFDDPDLKLVHVMAGFNVSNGYDYQVYGYIPGKDAVE